MGAVFTTELESKDGLYVSLFESKDKSARTWTIREEFKDKELLTRLASVIDLKRQVRNSSQLPIGWNVSHTFVPKFEKLSEIDIQIIAEQPCGNTPQWCALYHEPSICKFVDRPNVRVHRLCVSKKHLKAALDGETPVRTPERIEIIRIATCSYNN